MHRAEVDLEGWGPVVDIGFHKDSHLAALTSGGKGGGSNAHLVLLRVPFQVEAEDDSAGPSIDQVTHPS